MENLQDVIDRSNTVRQLGLYGERSPRAAQWLRDQWLEAARNSRTGLAGWHTALAALVLQHGAGPADKAMRREAIRGRDADYRTAILNALGKFEPQREGRP